MFDVPGFPKPNFWMHFHKILSLLAAFVFAAISALCASETSTQSHYEFEKEIPIGGQGGWDYLSVDAPSHRLFVSHGDRIVVIDLGNDQIVSELTGMSGVHGAVFSGDRIFTSNGRENSVGIYDLKTLAPISKSPVGKGPDAMIYEPGQQEVYTFNGRDQSVSVIDAKSGKPVTTIALDGRPEFAVAYPKGGLVFCNIEDKNELVAIDTKTHQVVNRWPIAPGEAASGLDIDPATGKLFLGCDNRMMIMMDGMTGKVLSTVPIGEGVDAVIFDPSSSLAFSSNGEGNVTIARVEGDKMTVVQTLKTEKGARTMTIDPITKKIYLASAKFEPVKPSKDGQGSPWPKVVPGTLKMLVYAPKS